MIYLTILALLVLVCFSPKFRAFVALLVAIAAVLVGLAVFIAACADNGQGNYPGAVVAYALGVAIAGASYLWRRLQPWLRARRVLSSPASAGMSVEERLATMSPEEQLRWVESRIVKIENEPPPVRPPLSAAGAAKTVRALNEPPPPGALLTVGRDQGAPAPPPDQWVQWPEAKHWRLLGLVNGGTIGGVAGVPAAYLFYNAASVRRLPDAHLQVWVKSLPQAAVERAVRAVSPNDNEAIDRVARKVKAGYMPPNAHGYGGKMSRDQLIDSVMLEEIANEGDIEPISRELVELDCENRMYRWLSVEILVPNYRMTHPPSGWDYIPPESLIANAYMDLAPPDAVAPTVRPPLPAQQTQRRSFHGGITPDELAAQGRALIARAAQQGMVSEDWLAGARAAVGAFVQGRNERHDELRFMLMVWLRLCQLLPGLAIDYRYQVVPGSARIVRTWLLLWHGAQLWSLESADPIGRPPLTDKRGRPWLPTQHYQIRQGAYDLHLVASPHGFTVAVETPNNYLMTLHNSGD